MVERKRRKKSKVLVGVATYPDNDRPVHPWTQECLENLVGPSFGTHGVKYYHGDQEALSHRENLAIKHNQMRADVIEGGYSHLMLIEADMVFPVDSMRRLLEIDTDVAYGLYVARLKPRMWLCFQEISQTLFYSVSADRERAVSLWGQVVPSKGMGFGCSLIKREVLEQISFRINHRNNMADDLPFCLDVEAARFESKHDLGLICGHINGDKVLWPDHEEKELYRSEQVPEEYNIIIEREYSGSYKVLKPISASRTRPRLRRGDVSEFEGEMARILLSKGAIELIEPKEDI